MCWLAAFSKPCLQQYCLGHCLVCYCAGKISSFSCGFIANVSAYDVGRSWCNDQQYPLRRRCPGYQDCRLIWLSLQHCNFSTGNLWPYEVRLVLARSIGVGSSRGHLAKRQLDTQEGTATSRAPWSMSLAAVCTIAAAMKPLTMTFTVLGTMAFSIALLQPEADIRVGML